MRDINPRLRAERYEDGYDPNKLKSDRTRDGKTITENVYGNQKNKFRPKDDHLDVSENNRKGKEEYRQKTGRVVPFFPSMWNKNANLIFNEDMQIVDVVEEGSDKAIAGARPTSGKHYSRHFSSEEIA